MPETSLDSTEHQPGLDLSTTVPQSNTNLHYDQVLENTSSAALNFSSSFANYSSVQNTAVQLPFLCTISAECFSNMLLPAAFSLRGNNHVPSGGSSSFSCETPQKAISSQTYSPTLCPSTKSTMMNTERHNPILFTVSDENEPRSPENATTHSNSISSRPFSDEYSTNTELHSPLQFVVHTNFSSEIAAPMESNNDMSSCVNFGAVQHAQNVHQSQMLSPSFESRFQSRTKIMPSSGVTYNSSESQPRKKYLVQIPVPQESVFPSKQRKTSDVHHSSSEIQAVQKLCKPMAQRHCNKQPRQPQRQKVIKLQKPTKVKEPVNQSKLYSKLAKKYSNAPPWVLGWIKFFSKLMHQPNSKVENLDSECFISSVMENKYEGLNDLDAMRNISNVFSTNPGVKSTFLNAILVLLNELQIPDTINQLKGCNSHRKKEGEKLSGRPQSPSTANKHSNNRTSEGSGQVNLSPDNVLSCQHLLSDSKESGISRCLNMVFSEYQVTDSVYKHHINYLGKIKEMYRKRPDVWDKFDNIFDEYCRIPFNSSSKSELFEQIKNLFPDEEDLLSLSEMILFKVKPQSNEEKKVKSIRPHLSPIFPQPVRKKKKLKDKPLEEKCSKRTVVASSNQDSAHTLPNIAFSTDLIPERHSDDEEYSKFAIAKEFIMKVAVCLQNEPNKLRQFLEIIRANNERQIDFENGTTMRVLPLTATEIYTKIEKLIDQKDLMQEFISFLPKPDGKDPFKYYPLKEEPCKTTGLYQESIVCFTLLEAVEHLTLHEAVFCNDLHKSLENKELFLKFMETLKLYKLDAISSIELTSAISEILSKYPALYERFIDLILPHKEDLNAQPREASIPFDSCHNMKMDFSGGRTCGVRYREISPKNVHSKDSGTHTLGEVLQSTLNDTWALSPAVYTDSANLLCKKLFSEEVLYNCEDERSDIDIKIESNQQTIACFTKIKIKLDAMTPEERLNYRLDDNLGSSSYFLNLQVIKRVYDADVASEIIDALKTAPYDVIPVVLKRLILKDVEWRAHRETCKLYWNEQNKVHYYKSLDHCGSEFKQSDAKFIRTKSFLSEIKTAFNKGQNKSENSGINALKEPHIAVLYRDKSRFTDALNVIIHQVKRQKVPEDRKRIKALVRQFIPDLFHFPREQQLSSSEGEDVNENEYFPLDLEVMEDRSPHPISLSESLLNMEGNLSTDCYIGSEKEVQHISTQSSCTDETYTLIYGNSDWYVFFRLHQLICERLGILHEQSEIAAGVEIDKHLVPKNSVEVILNLKNETSIGDIENYYSNFLRILKERLDSTMEDTEYEDILKRTLGIHSYQGYGLDKVVLAAVRKLRSIVNNYTCVKLYFEARKFNATGGLCSTAFERAVAEKKYESKCRKVLRNRDCFKIMIFHNAGKLTVELLPSAT